MERVHPESRNFDFEVPDQCGFGDSLPSGRDQIFAEKGVKVQ